MGGMGGLHWIGENWVTVLNAVGIVGGLLFTAFSLRSETKTRRIANLLAITQNHREVWTELYRRPALERVLKSSAELARQPVSVEEEIFVNFVILHLNSVYQAIKAGLVIKPEGVRRDVWWFFSLPIPQAVWEKMKVLHNDDFVSFVDNCRNWK